MNSNRYAIDQWLHGRINEIEALLTAKQKAKMPKRYWADAIKSVTKKRSIIELVDQTLAEEYKRLCDAQEETYRFYDSVVKRLTETGRKAVQIGNKDLVWSYFQETIYLDAKSGYQPGFLNEIKLNCSDNTIVYTDGYKLNFVCRFDDLGKAMDIAETLMKTGKYQGDFVSYKGHFS